MRTQPSLLVIVTALIAAAACFEPEFHDPTCGPSGECPDGTSCVAGVCAAPVEPDATTTPGCPDGQVTSLSGTVFAPNGSLPLHDVLVYVPQDGELQQLPEGASCTPCGAPPSQVFARTGSDGAFVLRHVPAGADLRVVIETGKWRRQITVPAVPSCVDTALAPDLTRLPRTRAEGDLPRIALTTGQADTLECLLRKIGIADGELGIEGGPERVHLYAGNGAARYVNGTSFTSATPMWSDPAKLAAYDHVLLSCEGSTNPITKPPQATAAMYDYVAAGGRVLAEHFHSYWITAGPPQLQGVAEFQSSTTLSSIDAEIDLSMPRGVALAAWLDAVGASSAPGRILIQNARRTASSVGPGVDRLVHHPNPGGTGPAIQMFAFTTPPDRPEEQRCGRFVFSDAHVGTASSSPTQPFPTQCTSEPMRPQEKLLAYALFDLGRCVGGLP
jgi:hypothetical protein